MATADNKPSQRDLAYGVIRRAILLGHAERGSRVNERVLAEQMGISRMPVREALLCLHGEGLVSKSKWGMEVTKLSPDEAMFQVEFRAIVECAAARLAAERITDEQVRRLREIVAQQEILDRADDVDAFRESDLAFHQLILRATRNPFIMRLSGTLAMGSLIGDGGNEGIVDGHRDILNAIAGHDADKAEQMMYAHVANAPFECADSSDGADADERA